MGLNPEKIRRPGYAPAASVEVGRRGLHTRDRILACAAEVFLANGFHGTSLETIAKAAQSSRATVYQYFAGKEEIFRELSAAAARDVLAHGERLRALGPTADGISALHSWLVEWADIYDAHAAAFAEYPGIGTELSVVDVGNVAKTFGETVTAKVREACLTGLDADNAAAVLGRIPHMVHLYRWRALFPLPERDVVNASLTVALQLMLFPDTPAEVLQAVAPWAGPAPTRQEYGPVDAPSGPSEVAGPSSSPIRRDVLNVSSALFAERGYYAVGMEEIATGAGVSRATLYRYFSTKDKILAELTRLAVSEVAAHAEALPRMAATGALPEWMLGYVRFHRSYRGVIRAWFDGTVAEQLSDAAVEHGIGTMRRAVADLLDAVELPPGIDRLVANAVFAAVLGRMTEPTEADGSGSDERAAALMVTLLRRSLLRSA